ncbi:MAG: hypothetical protein NDI69_18010 [Bacteriovoracaceae bacterium]|nr:hypothetical protein [Bacteriovoracaceae bacterium]
MKNIKCIIASFAVSCTALLHSNSVKADLTRPRNDRSIEQELLKRRYSDPMSVITDIFTSTMRHCNRLPAQKEFKDFILNGAHENIKCSKIIKTRVHLKGEEEIGKNIQGLTEFLERNEHRVYSDTKKFYVVLKQNSKDWVGKKIKSHKYEFVISCTFGTEICDFVNLELRVRSCRANEAFAKKHCYFNSEKIIDY